MPHDFEPLSARIIEAAIEVHKTLGPGFPESVYENALRVALNERGLAYESQKEFRVLFRSVEVVPIASI